MSGYFKLRKVMQHMGCDYCSALSAVRHDLLLLALQSKEVEITFPLG